MLVGSRAETDHMSMPDLTQWIAPTASVVAAALAAFLGSRFGQARAERHRLAERRRELADACIGSMQIVRALFRDAERNTHPGAWELPLLDMFEAIDDARHLMPNKLRHLHRSLRAAMGEGLGGVARVEFDSRFRDVKLMDYDERWAGYAREYLERAIDVVRLWRDASDSRSNKIHLLNYDEWLSATGRYHPIDERRRPMFKRS